MAPARTLGPPPWTSWREGALTRASELETLHESLCTQVGEPIRASIRARLAATTEAAAKDNSWWRSFTGATFERDQDPQDRE